MVRTAKVDGDRALIMTLIHTALRQSEALSIRVGESTHPKRLIQIRDLTFPPGPRMRYRNETRVPAAWRGDNAVPGWEQHMRVLVVEDEPILADTVAEALREHGWAADVAYDGAAGLEKAQINRYDVVVLDRDLPRLHGDEVCEQVVLQSDPPRVLMLTASARVHDRVEGLDRGADDYLCKPFAFAELLARVTALARRSGPARPPVLSRAGIALDPARRTASREGRPLRLTRKEFAVLELLLAADGAVVSAEELLERAWDEYADPFTNAVRITVANLRRKLGDPPVVHTVIGAGYRV